MQEPDYEPTQEEIREMCAKIREGWSEREHWQRRGYADGKPVYVVPRVCIHVPGRRL